MIKGEYLYHPWMEEFKGNGFVIFVFWLKFRFVLYFPAYGKKL